MGRAALLLAALLTAPVAQAEWLYREAAIMGTRCTVELWSADRDSSGMAGLVTRNPLLAAPSTRR